jgi:hypothetical protein
MIPFGRHAEKKAERFFWNNPVMIWRQLGTAEQVLMLTF